MDGWMDGWMDEWMNGGRVMARQKGFVLILLLYLTLAEAVFMSYWLSCHLEDGTGVKE
jgi:hypothetical protein